MSWHYGFRPYVPVARRRAQAAAHAAKLAKKENRSLTPISLAGRKIASSFWGNAWCENLERYSDFANRIPRGRTYVRNGSVIDLQIERGKVKALVSGSQIYHVTIGIKTLPAGIWSQIKKDCARSIDSLMDLLQGRFDEGIMRRLTEREGGLFPQPREIDLKCSCPDWATMCKHVAATLYGVGARLDTAPELLFTLRDVDHLELISQAVTVDNLDKSLQGQADTVLAGSDLGEIFGIELDTGTGAEAEKTKAKATVPATTPLESGKQKPRGNKKPALIRGQAKTKKALLATPAPPQARTPKKALKAKSKAKAGEKK